MCMKKKAPNTGFTCKFFGFSTLLVRLTASIDKCTNSWQTALSTYTFRLMALGLDASTYILANKR